MNKPSQLRASKVEKWGEVFRACKDSEHITFEMKMPKNIYAILLTEATAHGIDLFQVADKMMSLGLKLFQEDHYAWAKPTTPPNVVPFPSPFIERI
jgi:hypothetical protein